MHDMIASDGADASTAADRADGPDAPAEPWSPAPAAPAAPAPAPLVLVALAACSVAAAAIHFSMVLPHRRDDPLLSGAFVVAAWIQVGTAVAVVLRPSRALAGAMAVVNGVFVAAWAVSRVAGLPFGSHAGTAEAASYVDVSTAALEAGVVLLGAALVARPGLGARLRTSRLVVAVPVVAVLALASSAMTSTSAVDHGSAGHGGDGHAAGAPHADHLAAGATADHPHDVSPAIVAADDAPHAHAAQQAVALDMATQQLLSSQLAAARAQTLRYPTVADVKAAGGKALSVFTPFTGAHHTMPVAGAPVPTGGFDLQAIMGGVKDFDAEKPPIVLYSGMDDTSVVVGVMYVAFTETEPEGFAGPNDRWHKHMGVCAEVNASGGVDVLLPIERDTTKAECDAAGGNHLPVTPWMLHVWTAPGWESPAGVFSHENPLLLCRDGTDLETAADFAKGCRGLA